MVAKPKNARFTFLLTLNNLIFRPGFLALYSGYKYYRRRDTSTSCPEREN